MRARRSGRRPTMTDVGKLAGVSQSSVSLVLNGMTGARIAEATKERVREAARALGYEPTRRKAPDGGLPAASRGRNVIAYLVDEVSTSPHPPVTIDGAREAAWEAGCLLAVMATSGDHDLEAATVEAALADPALLGVVYSTIFTRQVTLPGRLDAAGMPVVLLNCQTQDRRHPSVVPGEVAGGYAATERLLRAGHRRVGLIGGEPWMDASRDRLKGYRQALATFDVAFDPALVRDGDWHAGTGHAMAHELMRLDRPPTALFCASDLMAVGALTALRELGLGVPGDVAVVGYDDQEIARHTRPALTTVLLPNYEMGRWAVETLLAMARGGNGGATVARHPQVKMECPLVERDSVGPAADERADEQRSA